MARRGSWKYIRGTYEQLDLIDEDMQLTVGQSLSEYVWERVLKPWVEQSPTLPDDLLVLPEYICYDRGLFRVTRTINGKHYSFGSYSSKQEAVDVRDYISYKDWSIELCTSVIKLTGENYRNYIKDMITKDKGYQYYLRDKLQDNEE
jgi:hypothetical protein